MHQEATWICEFCEPRVIELSDSSDTSRSSSPETPQTFKEVQDVQEAQKPRSKSISEEEEETQNAKHSLHRCPLINKSESLSKDTHSADQVSRATQGFEDSHSGSHRIDLIAEEDFYDAIQPLPDPIWMGSFRILVEYFCTILAHMSNEASEEAAAVAASLPVLLHLDRVPKKDIWPLKFNKTGPTVGNIAVYFFPDNYRAERQYDHLVDEIIEN